MHEELILVIDDFYDDPLSIRNGAITQEYISPPSQTQSGSGGGIAMRVPCIESYRENLLSRLADHIADEVVSSTIEFRFTHRQTIKRQVCHCDGVDLAGILYLTLPQHCQGGTCFYRHKPTGHLFRHPDHIASYDFRSKEEWEEVYRTDMKFNRLVLYPGELFHAVATPYFGDSIEDARLTQNMFISLRNPIDLVGLRSPIWST